jgi:Tol biopolymer transport system component
MCDTSRPFGTPVLVDGINGTTGNDTGARLSPDELTVYFNSDRDGVSRDIYAASRSSRSDPFGSVYPLTGINTTGSEGWPSVTADGLTIFFETGRPSPNQVYVATRTTLVAQFSGAAQVANVATGMESGQPFVLPDESAIYLFIGADMYRAQRGASGQFDTPVALSTLNTADVEYFPTPTPDELTIYFASTRADATAKGYFDIWMATRASRNVDFGPPVNLQELNTALEEFPSWISADNCRIYFSRSTSGVTGERIYVAERSR